jgi:hypothetical protein
MPAALRPEDITPESPLPALLRRPKEKPRAVPGPLEPSAGRHRPSLARVIAVLLIAACVYFGVRLAGVDGLPALPAGLPAEETGAVVVVDESSAAAAEDRRELASLRAAGTAATATPSPDSKRRGHRDRRDREQAPPSSGGSGSGGGSGDGTDEAPPNVTLPVVDETPIPDAGIEVPSLPVDPETLSSVEVTVPELETQLP